MSVERHPNGELRYAPVQSATVRVLAPQRRLLPVLPASSALAVGAGGFLAGAAALATVRAARRRRALRRGRKLARRERPRSVVATRSFLVDVHLLGR